MIQKLEPRTAGPKPLKIGHVDWLNEFPCSEIAVALHLLIIHQLINQIILNRSQP